MVCNTSIDTSCYRFRLYPSMIIFVEYFCIMCSACVYKRLYMSSSRQLRRLDSVSRSRIYANFGETMLGLTSIRAYHAQRRFIDLSDQYMDKNQSCHLASSVSNRFEQLFMHSCQLFFSSPSLIRWLGIRLEMIANLLTLFAAITSVFMRDRMTAGIIGLTITYALQITHSLNLLARTSSDVETNIISVERINEYAELTPEAPWEIPEMKPSPRWPTNGRIQCVNLSLGFKTVNTSIF